MENQKRMKPSELLHSFSIAKAQSSKSNSVRIIQFLNADDHTARLSSTVPLNKPIFEPSPSEVWIEDYTAYHTFTTKLSFRNSDSVARRMKIEAPLSPYFKIVPLKRTSSDNKIDGKIAAGMEISFLLEFTPQEVKSYSVDLICCTEREKFIVPVRVRGRYAALSIPDEISFGISPVKIKTTKVLTAHNIGTRDARFSFRTSPGFNITPENAIVNQGKAIQIEVGFFPSTLTSNEGELAITDDSGQISYVRLYGEVRNVEVYLSQPLVEPNPTYISLSSRKPLRLINNSDYTLDFCWKAYSDSFSETAERERLLEELSRMEIAEIEQLLHETSSDGRDSEYEAKKFATSKYKKLRKAVVDDPMQFINECFTLNPLNGRVWARSEVEIIASFAPSTAALYSCMAYLEVSGQEARLPLSIRCQGIGAKAQILYNERLDFGDIFINDYRTRDFSIQNRGEIPATFELVPINKGPGAIFDVSPSSGTLAVNEVCKVEITFCSSKLGEIMENIFFKLYGSDEQLCVRFKANVIPPTFHFDVDQVDFGPVSYSFMQQKTVKLVNTSKIPINFCLRVPEESNYKKKEFEISPSFGTIEPFGDQAIQLNFTPMCVKAYDYRIVVAVDGVGSDLLSLPVKADSLVPEVAIQYPELEFGECYLRYPHKQTLVLENRSTLLYARYETGEQDDHSKAIAVYQTNEPTGVIKPAEKVSIDIYLSCEKLGNIRLPMTVTIPGSNDLPLPVTLNAKGTGPKVEIDQNEINWGNCSCLVDHRKILKLKNISLIPAHYKTFIRNARSKFEIDSKEGVLAPGESQNFILTANMDDTILFKDQLHILITEAENISIPLSIKGVGTTMWSQSDLKVIDFSYQMTYMTCEWSCTIENKGKRSQILNWVNKTVISAKMKLSEAKKLTTKGMKKTFSNKGDGNQINEEIVPTFSVFPSSIELKPRTACVFVFKGLSSIAGEIREELICETCVGKEKSTKVAFSTEVRGIFVNPSLIPSSPMLSFSYVHHPHNEITPQYAPLTLINSCKLPLFFTMKTQAPFSLDSWEAVLQPDEQLDVQVEFFPGYKDDYISRVINGKILITYTGHPQKDSIELIGDTNFPNLEFEYSKINFGCILNDTQKSIFVKVKNVSKVETSFHWAFVEDEIDNRVNSTSKKPYIPINQVFDILPIRGLLQPGESENIEFIYYGHANRKFQSIVACEVEGGPEYELSLFGEASSLCYKLDKQYLDFGPIVYNKKEDREFTISNVGKVPFTFNILIENISQGRQIEVSVTHGKIFPNDKQKIIVQMLPGVPNNIDEMLIIEVAHFRPVEFKILGTGIFATLSMSLPKEDHPASIVNGNPPQWKDLYKTARLNLERSSCATTSIENQVAIAQPSSRGVLATSGSLVSGLASGRVTGFSTTSRGDRNNPANIGQINLISPALLDDLDVELEASRLVFESYLLERGDSALETQQGELQEPASTTKKDIISNISFVLSQYVLDFENVVQGSHKIKKFSMTNVGRIPASFQLDKNLLLASGFRIEPERVVRLPEKQPVEFTATFQARKNIALGLHEVQLPVVMKSGPPFILTIRATITIPDITISNDFLDFGKIRLGTSEVIYTQLQNISNVTAEWSIKKPIGSSKDTQFFRVYPDSGILPPSGKVNVRIEFMPEDGRIYTVKFPLKVSSNPKVRTLSVRGEGSELRLSFNPPVVELGPVLPCSSVVQKLVEIINESDYDVEAFSLDFDDDYKHEEESLRLISSYDSDDIIRLPLRVPGTPFRQYLASNNLITLEINDLNSTSIDADCADMSDKSHEFSVPCSPDELKNLRGGQDYIVLGPPHSGSSTQAKLLGEKANLIVWSIKDAVKNACQEKSAFGSKMREVMGLANFNDETSKENGSANTEESNSVTKWSTELLQQVVCWRLAQADLKNGGVLDGFENSWLSMEDTIKAFEGVSRGFRVISLEYDDEAYEKLQIALEKPPTIDIAHIQELSLEDNKNISSEESVVKDNDTTVKRFTPELLPPSGEDTKMIESYNTSNAYVAYKSLLLDVKRWVGSILLATDRPTDKTSFLFEYHVREINQPLAMHNAIVSSMESLIRDLEMIHLEVPPPAKYQLIRRPAMRFSRKQPQGFTVSSVSTTEQEGSHMATRWVISARSSVQVAISFSSQDVGTFDSSLGFEVVGVKREFGLFCRSTCVVPSINCDPRNVFMNRIKNHPEGVFVQKKFVMSKSVFEFGPLIVDATQRGPSCEDEALKFIASKNGNMEVFRMSNASKYPIRIRLGLEKHLDSTFGYHPSVLELPEGETGEVYVWANPMTDGLHENSLVCCVNNNPEPSMFSISCYGCTPTLALRGPRVDSSNSDIAILDFERLLLNRQDERAFDIENISPVPVMWRVDGDIDLSMDFKLLPSEGTLRPFQKSQILATFRANSVKVHSQNVRFEYSDVESALKVESKKSKLDLVLKAEGYKIDVCAFDKENLLTLSDGNIDFGLVRVGEKHSKIFTLRNRGKYDIKYVMSIRGNVARECFKVDPMELVVKPDSAATVTVTFQSRSEISLRDCRDIKCSIIEMITGEPYSDFFVLTTVRSVFSLFRIQPSKGINFGPLKYNDQAKTKRIEIKNDGEFAFKYRLRAAVGSVDEEAFGMETAITPGTLNMSQFTVSPDSGVIDPGVTASIDISFHPKHTGIYRELMKIDISGRNPSDTKEPEYLTYEVMGESCFPGINSTDYESIFEEQSLIRSMVLNSSSVQSAVFAEKERVFNFGAIFAAVNSKGVVERFKILNPTKVSTNVHFQITPTSYCGSKEREAEAISAFTVQPSAWEIPPLEYRFVNVHFQPSAIMTYQAKFSAKVEDSPSKDGTNLTFELRGEGTLPCITITEPITRDCNGVLLLNFGRVRVSKSKDMSLSLRNDGILSATVLFSVQSNSNFLLSHGTGSLVVHPKTTEMLSVQFKPLKSHEEAVTGMIKVIVQNNPFDEYFIKLSGIGFKDDVVFEDLPKNCDEELHFDDIVLKKEGQAGNDSKVTQTKVFSLCNQSSDVIRFAWRKENSVFSFSPSVGHVAPKGYKLISATFAPSYGQNTSSISPYRAQLQVQFINYKDPEHVNLNWDENISVVSYAVAGGKAENQRQPEPSYDVLRNGSPLYLNCFGAADSLSYECDSQSIAFRSTFMFQVCTHKISIKNRSTVKLAYRWSWINNSIFEEKDNYSLSENPFEISPDEGLISAHEEQAYVVKFSPMEVGNYSYRLRFEVLNFVDHDSITALDVDVRGESLRPVCHFDIERSDYSQRRSSNLVGPNGELGSLNPAIKVVEMESLGIKVRNTRRFYVINPTNISYEFSWLPESTNNPSFRCVTPKGLMLAGKRCEMIFEFIPQDLELQEMFWRFKIPHFNVDQLFLFVGTTTEPRIAFDRGCVNFNALLVGAKASHTISLVNNEHIPFNFVFDKSSLDFAGETPALLVHPLNGVIPPNGRCPIEIDFIPNEEKTYNFNINCLVKRKPTRLSLNVKGEGYMIHDSLSTLSLDQAVIPVSFGQPNQIDFGLARIHDEVSRTIFIQNTGKFNLDFNWGMARHPAISIDPQNGTVKKNDKMTCKVTFNPIKPTSLDGVQLSCTIAGSRTYHFILNGSAIPPSVQFSFLSHDFGPCFIGMDDALPISESVYLNVLNQDADAVIDLDCHFEKKPYFRVDCPPMTLGPRESVDIPIIFTPRAEISYTEVISFSLNSSSVVNVTVRGEGIYAKVDLFNSSMHNINFGNLQLGHTISKMVKIINRSKRKVPIQIQEDFGEKEHSLEALGVSIFPQNEIVLKPKESLDLQLKLSATHRTQQFQKDISLVAPGSKKKLLTLSGSCQGMDVQLETDLISFGTVCMGSHLTRKIQLQNRGDLIAKFQWNIHQFQPDFTISPAEGTISPNQHKILEITFKPSGINPDVRYNSLPCSIEGGGSVFLTLTGCCVQQTLATGADIRFESRVREEEVKSIVIENKTNQPWNLHPVVQGDHWFCQENLAVAAEGKATLILHYYPLSMTQDSSSAIENKYNRPLEHSGSLFVAIPDGSALLYNLFGKALAPDYSGALSYSTPAKKTLSVSIPVNNWLKQSQSFDVEIDKSQNSESAVVQGSKSLFIQSASVRNYNVKIYCYLEGTFAVTIRFVNSRTGEYLLYKMDITVTQAEEIEVINLDAPVRQSVKKIITIENPFLSEKKIQFLDKNNWWKCSHPNVRVREISSISNRPEGSYEIEYRPLIYSSNPMEANLSISFVEIGEYCYKLILTSKLGAPERMLYFKTSLGSSQIQSFEFTTFNEKATEVNCSIQHPTFFSVPAVWKLEGTSDWDGIVSSLQIKFEPEALGEIRDMLVISSDLIGEYKCSLIGSSEPPMPQGPFVFTSSKDIEFKNVFSSARDFEINVDNPRFVVKSKLLTIPPKGVKMINVKYDAKLGTSTNGNTAKLFVTCSASKELPPWIYYLEAS